MLPNRSEASEPSQVAGLGFFPQANSTSGASVVDDMMHRYMQQCLEYHDQQLQSNQELPHFVRSIKVEDEDDQSAGTKNITEAVTHTKCQADPQNSSSLPTVDLTEMKAARDRAQAIVARFQQQQQKFFSEKPLESSTKNSSVFAAVRRICLGKEQERRERFLAKNFDYVTTRQQQRLQQQAFELSAAEEWNRNYHAILEERHQQRYEAQKQRKQYITTPTGIGTTQQKHHIDRESQNRGDMRSSIALYVSGFVNSSVDENVLRDLFQSYGTIEKIHIYRDKVQGNNKGDGLVIFEARQDPQEFLNALCGQMNGVELPCGTTLRVEPSLSNKKTKVKITSLSGSTEIGSQKDGRLSEAPKPETEMKESKDVDLDDFFASL